MTTQRKNVLTLNKRSNNDFKDLIVFRDHIQKINSSHSDILNQSPNKRIKLEKALTAPNPLIEVTVEESPNQDMKKYIREQIKMSERKILLKLDTIEQKLNQLLGLNNNDNFEIDERPIDEVYEEEEHIIEEYVNEETTDDQHTTIDEYSNLIFPISDEETFDWFMLKLKDDEYRNNLINKRWTLTRNVGTRSLNVSVKDFVRMHFELSVCIKYSVSGFGSRGTKKKKVDSKTLSIYVNECFNRSNPGGYSFEDVSKAITQFWGRSQDTYSKMHDRALKRDMLN